MKKTAILSTNDNTDYLSYLPYVQEAWNRIGWNTLTFYLGNHNLISTDTNRIIYIDPIIGYRDSTVVQVSRLFANKYIDGMIMTSDMDMMPLRDFWHPQEDKITCYGADLTRFIHVPICYIAATKQLWDTIIYENSIEEVIVKYCKPNAEKFEDFWFTDQLIVTDRLDGHKDRIDIHRSHEGSLAYGRIDRYKWDLTKSSNTYKIDCHLPRPFNQFEAEYLLSSHHTFN